MGTSTLWLCYFPNCFTHLCSNTNNKWIFSPTQHQTTISLPLTHFHLFASKTNTTTTTTRRSRRLKTDDEIRSDIHQFLVEVGLPHGHIPSTKELLSHGRNDLANIVRRRGHKKIQDLLTSSLCGNVDSLERGKSLDERPDAANDTEEVNVAEGYFHPTEVTTVDNDLGSSSEGLYPNLDSQSSMPTEISGESSSETTQYGNSECDDALMGKMVGDITMFESGLRSPFLRGFEIYRDDHMLHEDPMTHFDKDLNAEYQKELELSRLKEQIEKEKHALSVLQTKAEEEISKARKLISEKDAELHEAEESLSGLKEVLVEFCGDGDVVEVAGSFNGWHHPIKMDPQPVTSVIDHDGSRKSRFWSAVLWLYPGVYEIKFVVDGDWRTDPQRESVARGHICNNILRVDR